MVSKPQRLEIFEERRKPLGKRRTMIGDK